MERKLIQKSERIDSFISFMICFAPFLTFLIPFESLFLKLTGNKGLLILLCILAVISFYSAALIGFAFLGAKIRSCIHIKDIETSKYGFYEINNAYFSKDWNLRTETLADDIVTLNNTINVNKKYYLVLTSYKEIEISEEQFLELSKVVNIDVKPLLKLNSEEFESIENNSLISFCIC